MIPTSDTLRRAVKRRASNAASFIAGISFDTYRTDPLKRSACEMSVIASAWALATLKARGDVSDDDTVQHLIALGTELEAEIADGTDPEKSWQAVTVDLPRVAAMLGREV